MNEQVIETTTLENGLQVVVIPDHRAPVVLHSVWYRAGSMDEPAGQTGIAHMLEHLMFKGTKTLPGKEREKIIQRHGAEENAFTSRDYTAYYQKVSVEHLGLMMQLEADRMENLQLAEADFLPERDVVLEERSWRIDSKPLNRFFDAYNDEFWGTNHPYGHEVIGSRTDIENYTLDYALDWYNTHYAPNNAILLLVGDVTLAQILPLVQQHYGPATVKATPPRQMVQRTLPTAPKVYTHVDAAVQVPLWVRNYPAPSAMYAPALAAADPAHAPALTILAEILGGSQTGRLYQALVDEQKIADSANASYDATAAGEASLDIYVQPKPGVTLAQISAAVAEVLAEFREDGPTAAELQRAKMGWEASDVYARDDLFHQAYDLGIWLMAGGSLAEYRAFSERIQAVSVQDVVQMATLYLGSQQYITGKLAQTADQLGTH